MRLGKYLKKQIIMIEESKNSRVELCDNSVRKLNLCKWLYTWFGWL